MNLVSKCFHEVIDLEARLKKHVDAFPWKVYGNNIHTTYSFYAFIILKEIMKCLIWSSSNTSLLGSNLGKSFSKELGKGCRAPGMARASIVSHGWFASMFPPNLKFCQGYGIEVTRGFVSGGPGGP